MIKLISLLICLPALAFGVTFGVIGDSNSCAGAVTTEQLYFNVARDKLISEGYNTIAISSPTVGGERTDTALARVTSLITGHPEIEFIVISLGVNDGGAGWPTSLVMWNFIQCIEFCNLHNIKVILGTVDISYFSWPHAALYLAKYHEIYDILSSLYSIKKFPMISYNILINNSIGDYLHGNIAAHQVWGLALATQIREILEDQRFYR